MVGVMPRWRGKRGRILPVCVAAFLWVVGLCAPAQAVRVANCDDETYQVLVDNAGERYEKKLAPGTTFYVYGTMVRLTLKGQDMVKPRYYDEYCIWDGKLTLQRRALGRPRGGG